MNLFTKRVGMSHVCSSLFLVWIALFVVTKTSSAQNFDEGLSLYEEGQYEEAAAIFDQLDSSEGRLFSGKSYFSLGQYVKAKKILNQLSSSAPKDIYLEAQYTAALSNFQLKQFARSLEQLETFFSESVRTQLVTDGIQLYRNIQNYLSLDQRREVYHATDSPKIKFDAIRTAMGKVDYPTAKLLINQFRNLDDSDTHLQQVKELESTVSDSLNYAMEIAFGENLRAPEGITYNIGAALPSYQPEDPEFSISQGLYFGYLLAAEEYNQQHNDKKVFIRYQNTGASIDSSQHVMTNFAWNYAIDAVLGPLFSEPATGIARLAELYQVPVLAPLANSDSLNIDNPYVFQANPTFRSHGEKMAEFAVNTLAMDTLAVLADRNSLGETSAFAFRNRAEKLGAKVEYFYLEDLGAQGYEISEFTKYFTSDSVEVDSQFVQVELDAVYAPFTGQAAPTLIDLLLIDMQAMDSDVTILGSQEWGATNIPEDRIRDLEIYFSESYYLNTRSNRLEQFRQNYRDRFGLEANRFAMIGYDAANYLFQTLDEVENPALLKNALSRQPLYEGLINNIHFDGKHVNQEVKIFKLSAEEGVQPAQY